MTDPEAALARLVQDALAAEFGAEYAAADPLIRPSQFADYQSNVALSLAKPLGRSPRDIAAELVGHLGGSDVLASAEVSGPGFINLTLRDDWIAAQAAASSPTRGWASLPAEPAADRRRRLLGAERGQGTARRAPAHDGRRRRDRPGPRVPRRHDVIRAAHLGDWGTQFGMLIEHVLDVGEEAANAQLAAGEITAFYQAARAKFDADPSFADRSRHRVVALQAGDPETMRLWQMLVDDSHGVLRNDLRPARRHAHRRRHGPGELLQPDARRRLRRAGGRGRRGDQRRRAVRVPARLHRPGRQAAAADAAQERRRLRLRQHRHGRHQVPAP